MQNYIGIIFGQSNASSWLFNLVGFAGVIKVSIVGEQQMLWTEIQMVSAAKITPFYVTIKVNIHSKTTLSDGFCFLLGHFQSL